MKKATGIFPDLLIKRGDLFTVNLGRQGKGTNLWRPVLVVQNDIGNRYCDTIIVVPLTKSLKVKKLSFCLLLRKDEKTGLTADHVAIFSQVRTLPKERFLNGHYLGKLDDKAMEKVDRALEISLGLSVLQKLQSRSQQKSSKVKAKRNYRLPGAVNGQT